MKILITGGAGFIGSHLAERLLKKENDVFIIDNFATGKKENIPKNSNFIEGDISNINTCTTIFTVPITFVIVSVYQLLGSL